MEISVVLAASLLILSQIPTPCTSAPDSSSYVKQSCTITTYPRLCYESLAAYAGEIQSDPKLLTLKSLSVALNSSKSASVMMRRLSKVQGLSRREAGAMADCVTVVGDSVYQLQRSTSEMGHDARNGVDFEMQMSNTQTWVSAALTDENTCMDGFGESNMEGKVKTTVRRQILRVAHLTSNALALVNNYASARKARPL